MKPVLLLIILFCAATAFAQSKPQHTHKKQNVFTGVASYYHNKFEGRRMANGEKYSGEAFTAASNRLPLNKWVRVTNPANGISVIVKITDRMARNNKRLVDLSLASARKLRMIGAGIKRVKVELLSDYKPEDEELAQAVN